MKPSPDYLLGSPSGLQGHRDRVDICGVDEVDTALSGGVHDLERGLLVALITKGHCPEADLSHLKPSAPQPLDLHLASPYEMASSAAREIIIGKQGYARSDRL